MSQFIQNMERMLSLFKSVHNRAPHNSQEFVAWCEHVERNSCTVGKHQLVNPNLQTVGNSHV